MSTQDILNEREKTHGDFEQFAELWADLNRVIREHTEKYPRYALESNYPPRTIKHTTSVCMILNKIARIICGDPNFADHWDDIAGYAMLGKGRKEETMREMAERMGLLDTGAKDNPVGPYVYKPKDVEMKYFKEEHKICIYPSFLRSYSSVSEIECKVKTTCYFWKCVVCGHLHIHDIKQENVVEGPKEGMSSALRGIKENIDECQKYVKDNQARIKYCSCCIENASMGHLTCPNCLTSLAGIRLGFCDDCEIKTIHSYGVCLRCKEKEEKNNEHN